MGLLFSVAASDALTLQCYCIYVARPGADRFNPNKKMARNYSSTFENTPASALDPSFKL